MAVVVIVLISLCSNIVVTSSRREVLALSWLNEKQVTGLTMISLSSKQLSNSFLHVEAEWMCDFNVDGIQRSLKVK